jgi:tRNA-2-methylthio-N6-dimethylallyladenosine synthase
LIDKIRAIILNGSISQDMIAGFPTETEQDHKDTLSLMEYVKYNFGYMYSYSERPGTLAGRKMDDDVTDQVKQRLQEIVDLQQKNMLGHALKSLLVKLEVLVEKVSKNQLKNFQAETRKSIVVFQREL